MTATLKTCPSTVANEVASGDVVTLLELARRGPLTRGGKQLHVATITRWVLEGVRAADGRRVRLEAVRLGGRWVTSEAAYRRFLDAQTPELNTDSTPTPKARSLTQRARAADMAGRELARMGI
jgi:hypothetical protein